MKQLRGLAMVISLTFAPAMYAATINLSTGLSATGTLLTTSGAPDAHWTVDELGGGTGPAQVLTASSVNYGSGGWVPDGPNSSWIGRSAALANNGPAPYTFQTTFDLTGFNLSTVSISGSWSIDDVGTLSLNGTTIATLPFGSWTSLHAFSIATGSPLLNAGLNTLSITMTANDQNIEGVRLEGTLAGTPTPEPSTFVLLAGLGAFAFARSRARRIS